MAHHQGFQRIVVALATGSSMTLIACSQASPPVQKTPVSPHNSSLSLDGEWKVVSKSCDSVPVIVQPGEWYHFKSNFMAAVERTKDEAGELCQQALGYMRVLTSFSAHNDSLYTEKFTMSSAVGRLVCWKKKNGTRIEPAYHDKTFAVPEATWTGELSLKKRALALAINNPPSCQTGVLKLELVPK